MGLESATYINDFTTTNPAAADNTSQGDDHLRLIKTVLKATFPSATKAFRLPSCAATAAGTVNVTFPDDQNKFFPVSAAGASRVVNLPDCTAGATVNEDGFTIFVMKIDSSANTVTIDGSGSQAINGGTTIVLTSQYEVAILVWDKLDVTWYAYRIASATLTPLFTTVDIGATDTTLTRVSAGKIAVEGSNLLRASDVVNDDTTGGTALPASAEIVKTHGTEIDSLSSTISGLDATYATDAALTAGLALKVTIDTNTSSSATNYAVGSVVIANLDELYVDSVDNNVVVPMKLLGTSGYQIGNGGSQLSGTWRMRGGLGGLTFLVQRVS